MSEFPFVENQEAGVAHSHIPTKTDHMWVRAVAVNGV